MNHYLYLLINLGTILIPFVFSFHPKLRFWDDSKPFFKANLLVALGFILWDVYFTNIGVWGFNADYLMGYKIWNLPIEEVLFFICIPYACVFSYHCFGVLFRIENKPYTRWISVGLIVFSLVLSVVYINRLYTLCTFLLLALFLTYLQVKKTKWLQQYYTTYFVMLLPFFVVNGLLTGFSLEAPVVWYNPAEMINIRILAIPFEDAFYGFLLIGLNIFFFEKFRATNTH